MQSFRLPPVSAEFIKALEHAFPPFELKPGFCRDAAMKSCGEQEVIAFIKHKAMQEKTVTGDASALRKTTETGAVVKYGE
jgi:hypothetical protein